MADELTLEVRLRYTPSDANQTGLKLDPFVKVVSMTGTDFLMGTQSIGFAATEVLLDNTDIGTVGIVFLRNLDATNFVQVSSDDTPANYPIMLKPGEFTLFRLGQANSVIRALADTAAVDVQYIVFED